MKDLRFLNDAGASHSTRRLTDSMTAGKTKRAIEIQRKYYTNTADRYDSMHAQEGATDPGVAALVCSFLQLLNARSVLDVGVATGLGTARLKAAVPNLYLCGVEPVAALIRRGLLDGNASGVSFVCGAGEALPFAARSFDVVCEFATLHHVSDPNAIVKEMLRVARKGILLCDSNRFGQGSFAARLAKLVLFKCGLWKPLTYLRTLGKGYRITEGDGLAYSYSVYDSLKIIAEWADRVLLIPVGTTKPKSWFHPLLTSGGVLLCAMKQND